MLLRWENVANYRHTFQDQFSCTIKISRKSDLNGNVTIKELIMQVGLTISQSLHVKYLSNTGQHTGSHELIGHFGNESK